MSLLYFFDGVRIPLLNVIAVLFSVFGTEFFFVCTLGVIYWCFSKKSANKIFFTYIIFGSVMYIVNAAVHIPYPSDPEIFVSPLNLLISDHMIYSIPSAGLFIIGCLASGIFINNYNKITKLLCAVSALLTTASFLYLGLCSLLSAIISIVSSVLLTVLFTRFVNYTWFDSSRNLKYMLIAAIPVFVVICTVLSLYFYDYITLASFSVYIRFTAVSAAFLLSWYYENTVVRFNIKCDRISKQFLKAAIGIGSILVTKILFFVPAIIVPEFLFWDSISSFIAVLLGFGVFPVFIQKYFAANYN